MKKTENTFFIDVSRFDEVRNEDKLKILRKCLKITDNVSEADYILAIGGDGCLLNSISNYKHLDIPFLGIHGGTLGYYMQNIFDEKGMVSEHILNKIKYEHFHIKSMPLIKVDAIDESGETYSNTAFGDVWVERKEAQSLKYNICVETDSVPLFCSKNKFISGDGILFSTAAGSTGYARNIVGIVMPIGTTDMLVAPIHSTVDKRKLNGFTLNNQSTIKIDVYDTDFRIPRLNIDGQGVKRMDGSDFVPKTIDISGSSKTVKLAFIEENYLEYKSFDYLLN